MSNPYPSVQVLKSQAKLLSNALTEKGISLKHMEVLHLVAKIYALPNWNTLEALASKTDPGVGESVNEEPMTNFELAHSLTFNEKPTQMKIEIEREDHGEDHPGVPWHYHEIDSTSTFYLDKDAQGNMVIRVPLDAEWSTRDAKI